jgi:Glycosyl hydrolase-like 10
LGTFSQTTKKLLGQSSCPNYIQAQWLDWTIDEAKKQQMQVHAYFERGIKIDNSSPIYDRALARKWLVPGVDRTYPRLEQYVFDVEHPEVIALFKGVMTEFVRRYPTIDAVQWDDFLAYSVKLPGSNRTAKLTKFSNQLYQSAKQANPKVSIDLCHLNPDWSKRTLSADWKNWQFDRSFVQLYSEPTFKQELAYAERSAGIAITDRQLHRLPALLQNPKIKGIFIFPLAGNPHNAAANFRLKLVANNRFSSAKKLNSKRSSEIIASN